MWLFSCIIIAMQMFGLISLLITILIAIFWLTSGYRANTNEDGSTQTATYEESIDAASEAAKLMERN